MRAGEFHDREKQAAQSRRAAFAAQVQLKTAANTPRAAERTRFRDGWWRAEARHKRLSCLRTSAKSYLRRAFSRVSTRLIVAPCFFFFVKKRRLQA